MAIMNAHQQVFALSLMSNLAQEYKGTQENLQSALEAQLPLVLSQLAGEWRIVWGPVVWKENPKDKTTGPDHVWFVARNPQLEFANGQKQDTYVIAIAATATEYNWLTNNAGVTRVVDFNQWVSGGIATPPKVADTTTSTPGTAFISYGTALGVYRLASVAPPISAAGRNLPLISAVLYHLL
ncbi:hypothetical protein BN14_05178 [Rhizoctonia solani AG-1 IB]|uniref:Uncharacterized protein n=1 Tax=Thanatephorus cucumeris (strain AG1-IB / isolate 7/3/14) TaxID=1108050 RepID=M5BVF3_THACB|nr:hypothetical protein BN14_05178 [Rhizoctonia solani AG-1 IB]